MSEAELNDIVAADEDAVREILEELRAAYECIINARAEAGQSTRFLDFLMAVHNMHKLAVLDAMEREPLNRRGKIAFLRMWERTFRQAMEREIAKL